MRIKAAVIIILIFGAILAAGLLIENRKLSAVEIESVKTACVACHGRVPDYDQAARVHEIHVSFKCSRCHGQNLTLPPSPEPTATFTSIPSPVTTSSPPNLSPPPAEGPPSIPHAIQGHENCLECHGTGQGGAKQIPADHAGRTNAMCLMCHAPG